MQYDSASDQYTYVWKTEKSWSGTCRVLVLTFNEPDMAAQANMTPAQALLKYEQALDPATAQNSIVMLDHFPGLSQFPLFCSYSGWFSALHAWMPRASFSTKDITA